MLYIRLVLKSIIIFIIKGYQWIVSPLFPSNCIYYPTCSEYMVHSIKRFGVLKGLYLGALRIMRCSARYAGGYDEVPVEWTRKTLRDTRKKFKL